jgi:hypothetical protein
MLRNKFELLLQTSLGNSLRAIKGWSSDSVKNAYTRALQLCRESGLDEHTFPAVFGLWTWNFLRAALRESQALAEHLLNTAENVDDSVYNVLAHEALGFTLFAQGKFAAAHTELERSVSLCEDSKAAAYLDLSAQDPRVHVRLYDWRFAYLAALIRRCGFVRTPAVMRTHLDIRLARQWHKRSRSGYISSAARLRSSQVRPTRQSHFAKSMSLYTT